jgi:branched-chain amino acid transport system permease protein
MYRYYSRKRFMNSVTILDILIGGLLIGGIYALIAMGLSLQYGVARVLNVAHGEFIMLGAFGTWVLYTTFHINPLISLVIIGPIIFLVGFVLHRTFFRHLLTSIPILGEIIILGALISWTVYQLLKVYHVENPLIAIVIGIPVAIALDVTLRQTAFKRIGGSPPSQAAFEGSSLLATFGFLYIIQNAAIIVWSSSTRGYTFMATPVNLAGAVFATNRLVTLGFAVIIGIAFYVFLARTRSGKAIRAAAQDPTTAGLMGVNINQVLAICFGLGAALAGMAGVLYSMSFSISATMGLERTIIAIIVVVLGGLGSIPGSFIGGFLLGIIGEIVKHFEPSLALASYYVIFILLLMLRPKGIMGK